MKKNYLQLSSIFLTLLFFAITSILFTWYSYLHYTTIPRYQEKLLNMATKRTDDIDTFLNEQEKNAIKLSQKSILITALDNVYQKKNPAQSSTEQLTNFLSPYAEQMLFKNILLIDIDGNIIFSTTKNNIIGENINKNHLALSALSTSCERAMMTFTNDFSYFSFDELLQEPALFITIPILKNNKLIGTLAYQLNQEKIFLITNQYIGMGKTGEVTLGKRDGSYVVFVSPTRHDPDLAFKKVNLMTSTSQLSIRAGLLVKQGTMIGIDYRGKEVVSASTFIPKLDWGMIVKIDQEEILQPLTIVYKFLLLFFITFILLLIVSIYCSRTYIIETINKNKLKQHFRAAPAIIKNPLIIVLLIFCSLTIKNIIYSKKLTLSMIKNAQNLAVTTISNNAEEIEIMLTKIAFVGQSIASDLQSNHLIHEDIPIRLKRDLKENNAITGITILFNPYSYDQKIQLYAPSIIKTDDTYHDKLLMETSIDSEEETSIFKSAWYTQALKNGSAWLLNPITENNPATASYSCVFLDSNNKPKGIILITYSLADIIHVSEYSRFGQTGYSIILSDTGTFIFHPLTKMVQQQTTLLQFAQSQGNEELATIAQKALNKQPILTSYSSSLLNHNSFTIYTHPIPINNWIIGAIFPENEVSLPSGIVRHYYFWILIWLIMSLLTLCALLYSYNILTNAHSIACATILFLMALICSWYIIQITTTIHRESKTVITDQASLNKFLNDLNEEAHRKHETQPIIIPFGLFLFSLNTPHSDQIMISGYIWSKYNIITDKNISRSIDMPQATKIQFGTPLISTADNIETVTLNVQGSLFQEQNYAHYPFDQQQIRIIFEHRDIEKNIILTPDLTAYKKISPETTPGLDKEFALSGFTIEQAFFEYHTIDPTTNFGFKDYGKITDNFQLIYNVIMNRNLLNPFVLYLLPLLVILFSLFCTLIMTGKRTDPFSVLGPYTGLFFALVILHRSLREQLPTGTTLYMEYAFFYTYITIILLIIHTILTHYYTHWRYYQDTALHVIKLLFWPFQFLMWFITTLIIFY